MVVKNQRMHGDMEYEPKSIKMPASIDDTVDEIAVDQIVQQKEIPAKSVNQEHFVELSDDEEEPYAH